MKNVGRVIEHMSNTMLSVSGSFAANSLSTSRKWFSKVTSLRFDRFEGDEQQEEEKRNER